MSEEIKELKKKLLSTKKNGYDCVAEGYEAEMEDYCRGYKAYLDAGKTERLCAAETIRLAQAAGYRPYQRGMEVKSGDKLYVSNSSLFSNSKAPRYPCPSLFLAILENTHLPSSFLGFR